MNGFHDILKNFESKRFCRLCLKRLNIDDPRDFVNIIGTKIDDVELSAHIYHFYNVVIRADENISLIICNTCFNYLKEWVEMKKSIQKNNITICLMAEKKPENK